MVLCWVNFQIIISLFLYYGFYSKTELYVGEPKTIYSLADTNGAHVFVNNKLVTPSFTEGIKIFLIKQMRTFILRY